MAIKKSEAALLVQQELDNVKKYEGIIDKELQSEYDGEGDVCVDFKKLGRYPSERECKRLVVLYESAGWKVEIESDQKKGSWFRFS